jgi:hypothetical protein
MGSGLNYLDYKYIRAKSMKGCKKQLLNINVVDSFICCEQNLHQHDWICVAAFDSINQVISSILSFFLPFIPLVVLTLNEACYLYLNQKFNRDNFDRLVTSCFLRGVLLSFIILFRTVNKYFVFFIFSIITNYYEK